MKYIQQIPRMTQWNLKYLLGVHTRCNRSLGCSWIQSEGAKPNFHSFQSTKKVHERKVHDCIVQGTFVNSRDLSLEENNLMSGQRKSYTTMMDSGQMEENIRICFGSDVYEYSDGKTTPQDLLKLIKSRIKHVIIARLNGEVFWELDEPLVGKWDKIEFLTFEEAKDVFWHSSAHILGAALMEYFHDDRIHLVDGPPIERGGFYYDFFLDKPLYPEDIESINKICRRIIHENMGFQRKNLSKKEAIQLFQDNPFKLEILSRIPNDEGISAYETGNFVDLCRGPHIDQSKKIGAFEITNFSKVYYQGSKDNIQLYRVYGISFPNQQLLKEYKLHIEEMKKRDHRVIGQKQKLFMFHEYSPGTPFFLEHGTRIVNNLIGMMRKEYKERGYQEVITPQLFNKSLWETSGHWQYYQDDMFVFEPKSISDEVLDHLKMEKPSQETLDDTSEVFGLKPMNCPAHCLIFKNDAQSYKDLPIRLADFSPLHRNELRGALSGLTRVRRFVQDDGHIFVRKDQIQEELLATLEFVKCVYDRFNMNVKLVLSTRPSKFIGTVDSWNQAETVLKNCLSESAIPWTINHGDGAFYGPKIDIAVEDSLSRSHQCATIQLDFQLPKAFDLKYQTATGTYERPVIIHRAIFGSVERFFALLTEHYAGKWPFWLSPRQILIVPVSLVDNLEYAESVKARLSNFHVDIAVGKERLNKKIRNGQTQQYNFILVLGKSEEESNQVNVRTRQGEILGQMSIATFKDKLEQMINEYE